MNTPGLGAADLNTDDTLGLPRTRAWARFEWDCPTCGDAHDIDHDPAGEVVACESCGERCYVGETC